MSTEEIKEKVQAAYKKAISTNMHMIRNSSFLAPFRDLKLYGREAGMDFVQTNLDLIVREAVSTAECRETSLSLPFCGSGRAALEGVADALRDITALRVEVQQSAVQLIWAVPNLGLI